MIFDFRKIASTAASTLLIGSTVALAAAANYPDPFVKNGASDVAVVYGSNLDLGAVADITTSLSSSTTAGSGTAAGTTPTGADFVRLDKTNDKLNLANAMNGPFGSTVNDEDLPTLLADGTYSADDNDEFDYEQKITLGSTTMTHFRDSDWEALAGLSERTPTIGFKMSSGTLVANYTLDFLSDAASDIVSGDMDDIEGSDIPLLGKMWYVSDLKNGTDTVGSGGKFGKLTLLDSATTGIVMEGETASVVLGTTSYDVSINFVGTSTVKFDVNGEVTNALAAGETFKLADGTYINAREINVQDYAGGTKTVEFSLGKGKLEITSGSNVKLNDDTINGIVGHVIRGTASSGEEKVDKITIEWSTDDEEFITPQTDLVMPGFGGMKFSMNEFVRPVEEKITLQHDSDTSVELTVPIKDGTASFNLLFSDTTGNFTGIGKASDERLATSSDNNLRYIEKIGGNDHDKWFVATYNTTTSAESYLLRATVTEDTGDGRNETTITNVVTGVDVCPDKAVNDECTFGDVTLTVNEIYKNGTTEWVNFTAGSNVHFNIIYSAGGLKFYLPTNLTEDVVSATNFKGELNFTEGTLNTGNNTESWYLYFDEEDKDDNKESGRKAINATINDNSDKELQVSQYAQAGTGGAGGLEVGDTSTYEAYEPSDIATRILHYTNPDQDHLEIYYPSGESESYAEVFLTAEGAETGVGGEVGGLSVMDTELASSGMQSKNLIVVGGTCVNEAAATLLGVSSPTCGAAWTSATGVGSGEFLVETFANPWSSTKVATLVAGYERDDTVNAATWITTQDADTTVGKKYKGSEATSASLVTG